MLDVLTGMRKGREQRLPAVQGQAIRRGGKGEGEGVVEDAMQAVAWCRKAAEQGLIVAICPWLLVR